MAQRVKQLQSDSDHIEVPNEILYDSSGGIEIVKAGNLSALVEHLTRHDKLDALFNRTFLTTYKYFTTTGGLIDLLITRFNSPQITDQTKPLVRLRVINILKQWLEHFWTEPKNPESDEQLEKIRKFASSATATAATETSAVQQLLAIIQRRLAGLSRMKISRPSISNPPKPILPRKLDKLQFMKLDAREIARQLTIMEAHMFSKIQPTELLKKSWTKKESFTGATPAPNVRDLIRYSNQLSNWVGALVLAESDFKKRAQVIGQLVSVAHVRIPQSSPAKPSYKQNTKKGSILKTHRPASSSKTTQPLYPSYPASKAPQSTDSHAHGQW